jgi:hypothetical protein
MSRSCAEGANFGKNSSCINGSFLFFAPVHYAGGEVGKTI